MADKTPCEQLATSIGAPGSKSIADIFEVLTDEDEAKFLLAASPPGSVAEIAERTGLAAESIEKMVDPLFRKGLLFKSKKPDATRYYRVRHVLQFHDATAVALDPPQEMLTLWKQYMEEEFDAYAKEMEAALPGAIMRVIPVNESVESSSQVMAFEDLEKLVAGADKFAVTKCSCRVIDGACGKPLDVCLQINRAAEYAIERGTGRELTKRETLEMLLRCEEDGLVHVADNQRSLGHVICNCCGDCCLNWTSIRGGLGKMVAPSRFRAEVEADDCTGCELCVERCYFDAMLMDDETGVAVVETENCLGCGLCQVVCPTDAIGLQLARSEEFIPA
jgi:Pyruvate/2-oxoacid:ferredoxin oxidoreductase delta subunit/predicted transcriptional regulator